MSKSLCAVSEVRSPRTPGFAQRWRPPDRRTFGGHLPGVPLWAVIIGVTALPLICMAPVSAQEREAVTGQVVDALTDAPIVDALVEVQRADGTRIGSGLQVLTDLAGRFAIGGVPEGSYLIQVQHLGYGVHHHAIRIQGSGTGAILISISQVTIALAPVIVEAEAGRALQERASPASRNIITRDRIEMAAETGVNLGDFLRREVSGISVRSTAGVGGLVCVEFRGAQSTGTCRPPEVILDGAVVPQPLNFFGQFDLAALERVQVIPPSEGVTTSPNAGWGVILLETRRGSLRDEGETVMQRRAPATIAFDWSQELEEHSWAQVYGSAFLGNALGLAAGMAILNQCMDLGKRRILRGREYCGHGPLLASSVAVTILPALGGSLAGRMAGTTDRSRGSLRQSILYSIPMFVPGFALASLNSGSEIRGIELAGLVMVVVGAPVLNTLADRRARELR